MFYFSVAITLKHIQRFESGCDQTRTPNVPGSIIYRSAQRARLNYFNGSQHYNTCQRGYLKPQLKPYARPLFTSRDQLVGKIDQWHCRLLFVLLAAIGRVTYK